MRRMIGRLMAICGWLAWQVRRRTGSAGRRAPAVLGIALLVLALLPIAIPQFDPQPEDATVQQLMDGAIAEPTGWVRLRGRVTPLTQSPTGEPGDYALLVDAANHLRAIVVRTDQPLAAAESTMVTGHVADAGVKVDEDLPIEATVFGAPPQIATDRILDPDPVPKPVRAVWWQLSLLPILLGIALLIGSRVGYPLFRPTTEIDVLASPLGPGERVPAAYGGRIGANARDLADPGGALLLVRRGPKGNLLTAQPLADDGGVAPAPVTIGGGWTNGRLGEVRTISETVPALKLRSELVDAVFLFARTAERDRVAALVAVDR